MDFENNSVKWNYSFGFTLGLYYERDIDIMNYFIPYVKSNYLKDDFKDIIFKSFISESKNKIKENLERIKKCKYEYGLCKEELNSRNITQDSLNRISNIEFSQNKKLEELINNISIKKLVNHYYEEFDNIYNENSFLTDEHRNDYPLFKFFDLIYMYYMSLIEPSIDYIL